MKKRVFAGVVLSLTMAFAQGVSFGAVANDEITSVKIKEATTGSTSQDTNSGNGIKTGHIVDTAVTSAKIANGAVTASKLGITCPAGQYLQYSGTTWVCSVGTAGPAGPAGAAGATGPQGESAKYANVVVVAKSGGDFTDPISAINSITDASASNPYMIKIYPGVYELNGQRLIMKSYVDIEGSGENTTRIRGGVNNSALVDGADNAEIRSLTIDTYGYWVPAGIMCNSTSPKITNVTVVSTGSPTGNYGIKLNNSSAVLFNVSIYTHGRSNQGIEIYNSINPTLNNINVTAESNPALGEYAGSSGIVINASTVQINNFTVKAIGPSPAGPGNNMGIFNYYSDVRLSNGSITTGADGAGISNGNGVLTVVQNTNINSPITINNPYDANGTYLNVKCLNSYDSSYNQLVCN